MKLITLHHAKHWLKHSPSPIAQSSVKLIKGCLQANLPIPKVVGSCLFGLYQGIGHCLDYFARSVFWTPMFKSRAQSAGTRLFLYGGMPYISGGLKISFGDHCRISGHTTFSGRVHSAIPATLTIGSNVDIGWQTTIASGNQIIIEDDVRIAGRAFLAGYPGHPINPIARAAGQPDTENQVGKIHLKKNVWLATGVSVMAGVTIGENSIIAAGSVVTQDIPANVLAAGVPARIIKRIAF